MCENRWDRIRNWRDGGEPANQREEFFAVHFWQSDPEIRFAERSLELGQDVFRDDNLEVTAAPAIDQFGNRSFSGNCSRGQRIGVPGGADHSALSDPLCSASISARTSSSALATSHSISLDEMSAKAARMRSTTANCASRSRPISARRSRSCKDTNAASGAPDSSTMTRISRLATSLARGASWRWASEISTVRIMGSEVRTLLLRAGHSRMNRVNRVALLQLLSAQRQLFSMLRSIRLHSERKMPHLNPRTGSAPSRPRPARRARPAAR